MADQKLQLVRGTKDLYGEDINKFNHITNLARKIGAVYGFKELATPIFEFSDVFERNLGESSDIIAKEVYKFPDRGDNFLTLRPEFTAGIIRAFITNGDLQQNLPQKFFSYGPVFRYDRPQKGRQRQFHQINFEVIAAENVFSDVELIFMAVAILDRLQILDKTTLQINSLGSELTKQNYHQELFAYFSDHKNNLSLDSKNRLKKNPLRILDSKDEQDIKIAAKAPLINNFYQDDAKERLEQTKQMLDNLGINYQINPRLVRGLDYYTGLVFEFVTNELGSQNTVLAGGRYDDLISKMGGPNLPAIGFAAGIERLMLLGSSSDNSSQPISIIYVEQNQQIAAFKLAESLRRAGLYAEIFYEANIKKQMKKAGQYNSKYAVIIGEDEIKNNFFTIKNFASGKEEKIANDMIINYFKLLPQ
jgi:histidyl-tRNA synthetase